MHREIYFSFSNDNMVSYGYSLNSNSDYVKNFTISHQANTKIISLNGIKEIHPYVTSSDLGMELDEDTKLNVMIIFYNFNYNELYDDPIIKFHQSHKIIETYVVSDITYDKTNIPSNATHFRIIYSLSTISGESRVYNIKDYINYDTQFGYFISNGCPYNLYMDTNKTVYTLPNNKYDLNKLLKYKVGKSYYFINASIAVTNSPSDMEYPYNYRILENYYSPNSDLGFQKIHSVNVNTNIASIYYRVYKNNTFYNWTKITNGISEKDLYKYDIPNMYFKIGNYITDTESDGQGGSIEFSRLSNAVSRAYVVMLPVDYFYEISIISSELYTISLSFWNFTSAYPEYIGKPFIPSKMYTSNRVANYKSSNTLATYKFSNFSTATHFMIYFIPVNDIGFNFNISDQDWILHTKNQFTLYKYSNDYSTDLNYLIDNIDTINKYTYPNDSIYDFISIHCSDYIKWIPESKQFVFPSVSVITLKNNTEYNFGPYVLDISENSYVASCAIYFDTSTMLPVFLDNVRNMSYNNRYLLIAIVRFKVGGSSNIIYDIESLSPFSYYDIYKNKEELYGDIQDIKNGKYNTVPSEVYSQLSLVNSDIKKYNLNDYNILSKLTWESGNLNDSSGVETISSKYLRSSKYYIEYPDDIFIEWSSAVSNHSVNIRVFFYDENDNLTHTLFSYSAFSNHLSATFATSRQNTKYVRFVIFKGPETGATENIDLNLVNNIDFTLQKLSFKNKPMIRIGSHNVKNFGTEYSYGYSGGSAASVNSYFNIYKKYNIDILGIQEFSPFMRADRQVTSYEFLSSLYKYVSISRGQWTTSLIFAGAYQIQDPVGYTFSTGRGYSIGSIEFDNKTITMINVHAFPGGTDRTSTYNGVTKNALELRQIEYQELCDIFSQHQYFIATGDYNARTISEFQIFLDNDYQLANGGEFGTFFTCDDDPNRTTCDNIICSSNLKIVNVRMNEDRELSDHRLLVADIIIP